MTRHETQPSCGLPFCRPHDGKHTTASLQSRHATADNATTGRWRQWPPPPPPPGRVGPTAGQRRMACTPTGTKTTAAHRVASVCGRPFHTAGQPATSGKQKAGKGGKPNGETPFRPESFTMQNAGPCRHTSEQERALQPIGHDTCQIAGESHKRDALHIPNEGDLL